MICVRAQVRAPYPGSCQDDPPPDPCETEEATWKRATKTAMLWETMVESFNSVERDMVNQAGLEKLFGGVKPNKCPELLEKVQQQTKANAKYSAEDGSVWKAIGSSVHAVRDILDELGGSELIDDAIGPGPGECACQPASLPACRCLACMLRRRRRSRLSAARSWQVHRRRRRHDHSRRHGHRAYFERATC